MAEILQRAEFLRGVMVTVTAARVSPDFSYARIYFSCFPFSEAQTVLKALQQNTWSLRRDLGQRLKDQLKNVPEVEFALDDSLEYIDKIDQALLR